MLNRQGLLHYDKTLLHICFKIPELIQFEYFTKHNPVTGIHHAKPVINLQLRFSETSLEKSGDGRGEYFTFEQYFLLQVEKKPCFQQCKM